jgi:DNA-binding NarL/FixJ family response regulator
VSGPDGARSVHPANPVHSANPAHSARPVRVLLADDQELVRIGLRLVLQAHEDLDVVGEAADGFEAVRLAEQLRPDVVLMDIRMPGLDGIAAAARLTAAGLDPPPRVVMLTTFDLDEYVFRALRAGAAGFLLKDASRERLVEAIHVVHAGDALLAPSVTRRLVADYARRADPLEPPEAVLRALTPRERETLVLVARGLSNGEIAERLVVSEATVKSHVSGVLTKLGLRDRVQAVVFAYEHGLVVAGEP